MNWILLGSFSLGIICFTDKLANGISGFQIGILPDSLETKSDLAIMSSYFCCGDGTAEGVRVMASTVAVRRMFCLITSLSSLFPLSLWEVELHWFWISRSGANSQEVTLSIEINLFSWRFYRASCHITSRLPSFIWEGNPILCEVLLLGPHLSTSEWPVYFFFVFLRQVSLLTVLELTMSLHRWSWSLISKDPPESASLNVHHQSMRHMKLDILQSLTLNLSFLNFSIFGSFSCRSLWSTSWLFWSENSFLIQITVGVWLSRASLIVQTNFLFIKLSHFTQPSTVLRSFQAS